jgi:P4 family phage/plasmid primase-like protien
MDLGMYTPDAHGFVDYFYDLHGSRVKYARDADRFYIYEYTDVHGHKVHHSAPERRGGLWEPSNGRHVEFKSLVQQVAKSVAVEGTGETAVAIAKLGKDSTGINKLVSSIMNDSRIWCYAKDFSANPYLLNFTDGTLDLTGEVQEQRDDSGEEPAPHYGFRASAPEDMLDSMLPVRYNPYGRDTPDWDTPNWDKLIDHMCAGQEDLKDNLIDALAYSLCGANPEQYIVFLVGEPNIGKTQVLELMAEFTGSLGGFGKIELITSTRGGFGEHDSLRGSLRGKRFVMLGEASAKIRLDEGKLKDLTGSAWVPTRELGKEQVNTRVTWTLYAATNELPALPNTMDDAVARRMWIFDLPGRQLDAKERDTELTAKITNYERGAVINKLAWRAWELFAKHRKLERCEACIRALDTYRSDYDTVSEFCNEHLFADEHNRVSYNDLHEAYLQFTRKHAYSPETKRKFIKRVEEIMSAERDSAHSTMKGISLVSEAPVFA